MNNDVGIVFVHGAGLGGYVWETLTPLLNHACLLLDFPNRKSGDRANSKLSFEDYVTQAISDTRKFDKQQLIVVAHSVGGLVGLRIAEHFADKIIGFVAVAAAIPKQGGSFVSCLPFPQRLIVPLLMKVAGTKPPSSAIESGLCNDLDQALTERVVENFTAESVKLFTESSKSSIPGTSKLYIELTNDKEFSVTVQRSMVENLNCNDIVTLGSGHLPMLSAPEELAKVLQQFIDRCA